MGEVYLAEDMQLHRKVALKILPEDVAGNHDRMRRFEQEATAAAALNHPNIAHVYEIGKERCRQTDSSHQPLLHFISMEYGIANVALQAQPNPTIDFYSFATGKWTTLLSVERSKIAGFGGRVAMSPDGQWIVYSQTDQTVNDIMLVENFH